MRLTEEDARQRLTAARVARLATTGIDGQPHLVPVTFAVDGELIYIAIDHKPKTTVNLRRLRNIRENPRVAVLADHYAQNWDTLWWVRADGRGSVMSAEDAIRRPLDLLAARYEQYRENRPEGPVIVIRVQRWTGWSSQSRLTSPDPGVCVIIPARRPGGTGQSRPRPGQARGPAEQAEPTAPDATPAPGPANGQHRLGRVPNHIPGRRHAPNAPYFGTFT